MFLTAEKVVQGMGDGIHGLVDVVGDSGARRIHVARVLRQKGLLP